MACDGFFVLTGSVIDDSCGFLKNTESETAGQICNIV